MTKPREKLISSNIVNKRGAGTKTPNKGKKIRSARYGDVKILKAVIKSGGMVQIAARKLGCTPKTIYDAIKRNPAIGDALTEQRELFIDEAENSLRDQVKLGEGWAVCFTLKTIGKNRGYIENPAYIPVAQQAVIVQQSAEVKRPASAYEEMFEMIAGLTRAKILPIDVLARFSTEGNGIDPDVKGNGGLPS